jgi:hypothetical protein
VKNDLRIWPTPYPIKLERGFFVLVSRRPSQREGIACGLPIAELAARRSLGDLSLEPVPDEGIKCVVKLPIPPKEPSKDN